MLAFGRQLPASFMNPRYAHQCGPNHRSYANSQQSRHISTLASSIRGQQSTANWRTSEACEREHTECHSKSDAVLGQIAVQACDCCWKQTLEGSRCQPIYARFGVQPAHRSNCDPGKSADSVDEHEQDHAVQRTGELVCCESGHEAGWNSYCVEYDGKIGRVGVGHA
jgi:hypothetical protein